MYFLLSLLFSPLQADEPAQPATAQDIYAYMQEALDEQDWWSAVDFGEMVLYNFPDSPLSHDILYQVGLAYFHLNQFEHANQTLTEYLHKSRSPKYFEEALACKLQIAEYFREGGKRRPFDSHKLPQLLPAEHEAMQIYDEIIATLPHHEMTAKALLGKAKVQAHFEEYRESVETLQLLVRRFPMHELAAEGFLQINRVYLEQCKIEHLDPDLLDLAQVNLRKFREAFPRDSRLTEAEMAWREMNELFAGSLLETGQFYERTKKPKASSIYYKKVVSTYPETKAAQEARERLHEIETYSDLNENQVDQ